MRMAFTTGPDVEFVGGTLPLPASLQQRLRERIRRRLCGARLPIARVVVSVFDDPGAGVSFRIALHVVTELELTLRREGDFLNPALDSACEEALQTIGRLERWLRIAAAGATVDPAHLTSEAAGGDLA